MRVVALRRVSSGSAAKPRAFSMIRPAALGLLATLALSLDACSYGGCEANLVFNLIVHVRASDGTDVCDATVELLDAGGKVVETMVRSAYGCTKGDLKTGQFSVRARRDARVSETRTVDVDAGEGCAPPRKTAEITLTLQP